MKPDIYTPRPRNSLLNFNVEADRSLYGHTA